MYRLLKTSEIFFTLFKFIWTKYILPNGANFATSQWSSAWKSQVHNFDQQLWNEIAKFVMNFGNFKNCLSRVLWNALWGYIVEGAVSLSTSLERDAP